MNKQVSSAGKRLLGLIDVLVEVVEANGGFMFVREAERVAAQRAGVSVSEMRGVIVNAHADGILVYTLRTGMLTLPLPESKRK